MRGQGLQVAYSVSRIVEGISQPEGRGKRTLDWIVPSRSRPSMVSSTLPLRSDLRSAGMAQ